MASSISDVISRNLAALRKPGVLAVRPGYEMKDDWFTGREAIVAIVAHKLADVPADERLPDELEGIPVDVRQASPLKRLAIEHPSAYASQLRLSPDVGSVPHFPDEVPLVAATPGSPSAHAELARIPKPQLDYTGPAGIALQPVTGPMTVRLSVSPDSGWAVLHDFLGATTQALTVGMYDFTSGHVKDAVAAAAAGKPLTLTLDHPPQNVTADQTDATTVADLRTTLGDGLTEAWALTRVSPDSTAWIFPTSYHIKVAVQDGVRFWLSSGNWNNSNQPAIDPVAGGPGSNDAEEARHRDRDWHVVIGEAVLANQFEQYLRNDLAVAAAHNVPPEQAGPPLTPPPVPTTKTPAYTQFFAAQTIEGTMTVAPLLTPDPGVYAGAVKQLIDSATASLYLQFQYIQLPRTLDASSQGFVALVDAVIAKVQAGLDVRIILGQHETAGYLEQLIAHGLDVKTTTRIQNNVHNKGIVVDSSAVLVSSQNWSMDGTLYNRDAGVIIHEPRAAQYFEAVFLHDWANLARAKQPA
ncbi:MAG TPA: phospholipase D-like domain-containing protein [Microbacterium sp.]|uniref:phospholipase D-like domain-containing protein n=1 Tax=Microbacterium sp. TaxID=51671 RepID=UPI002B469FD0|nr:phospholipase D-like domain-containing protein [Microbacterium sp.]HKT55964.1 phospholipase D-like domain-containing protein [Microbacterium sp.]